MKPVVLFVCNGNTCRSPMAEFLGKQQYGGEVSFASAGLNVQEARIHPLAAEVLGLTYGISVRHEPRQVTERMVREANKVVAFSAGIAEKLHALYGIEATVWEVADPWGKDAADYLATAQKILAHMSAMQLGQ